MVDYADIEKKLAKVNLGKTYLYVLVNKKFDFHCQENNLLFFPNKLDAMVVKILNKIHDYEIVKFSDINNVVKDLMIQAMEKGCINPVVILGYVTSSFSGRVQFVTRNGNPSLHAVGVSVNEIINGFDLNNYLMEYIIDDDFDEIRVLDQLVFSNLCSDEKLKEQAKQILDIAKTDGVNTDKDISIRHIFAYENIQDLKNLWGITR